MKNLRDNCLYLHCDECEWGWRDPTKIEDAKTKFLTLTDDFDAKVASAIDIEDANWQQYATNLIDE